MGRLGGAKAPLLPSFKGLYGCLNLWGLIFIFDLGLRYSGLILKTTIMANMTELSKKRCRRSILNPNEKKEKKISQFEKKMPVGFSSCLQQWKGILENGNFKNDCALAKYLLQLYKELNPSQVFREFLY